MWFKIIAVLTFSVGLLSCGRNGGGSGPSGGGNLLPATYLFYTGGSLWAVDPNHPTVPVQVESETPVEEAGKFLNGVWDAANQKLSGLHSQTLVYAKSDGNIHKISALKSDALRPSLVSNETGAAVICNAYGWEDFADPNASAYIYQLPGLDGICFSGDEILKMVRVGMSSTDSPITIPITISKVEIPLYGPASGAITGWLAVEGPNLARCDPSFNNCTTVTPFNTQTDLLQYGYIFTGFVIFKINNNLYSYNVGTGALSPSLYTFTTVEPPFVVPSLNYVSDATHLYFADGGTLLKLPLDGSSIASTLVTESGDIQWMELTTHSVVYELENTGFPSSRTLIAIGKDGGTAATLVPSTTDFIFLISGGGDWVYYQKGSATGAIKEDGTGGTELPNSDLAGFTLDSISYPIGAARIFRLEGCSISSCAGGTLKSFDAATNTDEVILGTLPPDISTIFFSGTEHALGEGTTEANSDIFYLKANQADSLVRVTNTPAISESPFF